MPIITKGIIDLSGSLLKLGCITALSIFSNRVLKEAGTQFINQTVQSYRQVKNASQQTL